MYIGDTKPFALDDYARPQANPNRPLASAMRTHVDQKYHI